MKAITRTSKVSFVLLVAGISCLQAQVPEPSTTFFGKVLHRANGNEHRLVEGNLTWTLRDQNGNEFTYSTALENIGETFSYRLPFPHQALSSGLNVDPSVIPLGVGETEYEFASIQVDGHPAFIHWSEIDLLSLMQQGRAATHRIDLRVNFDLLDTDGDGIPDWWEEKYGLDWQTADGDADSDGDGWSNLEEFLNGTDPLRDDRAPSVQTSSIAAYGESNNGIWLRTVDLDTDPGELVFTLTALPAGGYLHYVALPGVEDAPEYPMAVGDHFTQAELDQGRLAYRHTNIEVAETDFSVTLTDGVHAPVDAEISIYVFPPSTAAAVEDSGSGIPEWWRNENLVFEAFWNLRQDVLSGELVESSLLYLLGKNYGWTLWDQRAHTLPVELTVIGAGSHIILGGDADDVLAGGDEDDILAGGPGKNRLFGGGGLDLFIISHLGEEIIEDFEPKDDVLDLADLFRGADGSLDQYLQTGFDGTNSRIGVDRDGDGSGYTDLIITLENVHLKQEDLHRLWAQGQLLLGSIRGLPSVSITGWPTEPLEEGYHTAELTFRREGPVDRPLTASLRISGNATNGVDYTHLPDSVVFEPGQRTVRWTLQPLLDTQYEGEEVLDLALKSTGDYVISDPASGRITITDAKQRFSIFVIQSTAVVGGGPAEFVIVREGPKNTHEDVRLDFGGSAIAGADYTTQSGRVTFNSGQAESYLEINALDLGALAEAETSRSLKVALRSSFSNAYLLSDPSEATVRLLSDVAAFETWMADAYPEVETGGQSGDLTTAASPRTGMKALLEYAFSYGVDLEDGQSADELQRLTPQLHRDADGIHFEFYRRLNDPRLAYIVERSEDLVHWNSGPAYFEEVALDEAEENVGRVRYRVREPEGLKNCFIRVRVELNE